MIKDIKLFLRGMEADLPQTPDILFNYTEDDLRNPTIVKNSYTKTLTLDNTPANNKIFSEFVNNQFVVGSGFNPTKKMPFMLYLDGDLVESGYARLDSIAGTEYYKKYQITLFGGLGDFFYNLMYNDAEGGKRTMADLHYMSGTTSADEFNFTMDMHAIADGWKTMTLTEEEAAYSVWELRKWKYINFMPAYEGIPDDFDADKVLINFRDSDLISGVTSGTSAYTAFDGYALAEMKQEHTGDEMHEFRSYLQRPTLNVRKAIEAICKPENNGGYTVDLDSHFFNDDNPYWTDTWVTLPLLRSFDEIDEPAITGATITLGAPYDIGGRDQGDEHTQYYHQTSNATVSGTSRDIYNITMNVILSANYLNNGIQPYNNGFDLNMWGQYTSDWYRSCIVMQLVAYSRDGRPIGGGDAVNLTALYHDGIYPDITLWTGATLPWGTTFVNNIGRFVVTSGNNVAWSNVIPLSISNVPFDATIKLHVFKYADMSQDVMREYGPVGADYDRNNMVWGGGTGEGATYLAASGTSLNISFDSYSVDRVASGEIRTGSKFTKSKLLNTDYSPADFLLSYCKTFGLYFSKDRYEKKIYIRDRNTYYSDEVISATEIIDRTKMDIKPVFVGTKWLDFTSEAAESAAVTKYKEQFGLDYGIQRVNTGYEFNADINNLLKDSIFKGAITALEKSESFSYYNQDYYKPWMLEGFTYSLYSASTTEESTGVTYDPKSTIGVLNGWHGKSYKYYDYFEKLQFHDEDNNPIDGSGVLVFYNGNFMPDSAMTKYWITDDTSEMMVLNDSKPCWLWTRTAASSMMQAIAILVGEYTTSGIPMYSRYKYFGGSEAGGAIRKSLDFGTPKELFNPLSMVPADFDSDIYSQYWKNFVADLYSPDTRVITTRALLPPTFSEEEMRKWWWFDGALWRLNKVTEFNLAKEDMTSVEFVKVQDTDNYKLVQNNDTWWFSVESQYSTKSGGTVTGSTFSAQVVCRDERTAWNLTGSMLVTSISPSTGVGSTNVTVNLAVGAGTGYITGTTADGVTSVMKFIKSQNTVKTELVGSSARTSDETTVKIWVWTSQEFYIGHTWSARAEIEDVVQSDVVWTVSGGTLQAQANRNYCECVLPENTTGHDRVYNIFITNDNSTGDVTIVRILQEG